MMEISISLIFQNNLNSSFITLNDYNKTSTQSVPRKPMTGKSVWFLFCCFADTI